jgi:lysylphosphatidylglycerol synthetase-like protein (DUF2156 family)
MDHNEARARMLEIQRIMETATLYTLLPGMASIIGGVLVFIGCGVSYGLLGSMNFADITRLTTSSRLCLCVMWVSIACVAVAANVLLTARMARQRQVPINARPAQVALFALTPCVVVATALTIQFFFIAGPSHPDEIRYLAPVWMMLYGAGVYSAGLFSLRAPRVLGIAFIVCGIVSLFGFLDFGVISIALSFGLLHVVFGVYVIMKQQLESR